MSYKQYIVKPLLNVFMQKGTIFVFGNCYLGNTKDLSSHPRW